MVDEKKMYKFLKRGIRRRVKKRSSRNALKTYIISGSKNNEKALQQIMRNEKTEEQMKTYIINDLRQNPHRRNYIPSALKNNIETRHDFGTQSMMP